MSENKKETKNSAETIKYASTNVAGVFRKLWLEKSIADEIIKSFEEEKDFAEKGDFDYGDVYRILKSKWYFEAAKRQIFMFANHEMSGREVEVLDQIIRTYAEKRKSTNE